MEAMEIIGFPGTSTMVSMCSMVKALVRRYRLALVIAAPGK
jgi:hypothetical protein